VKKLRPVWRFLFFVAYTSIIVAEIWLRNVLQGVDMRRSMRIRRRWAIHLLKGLGVKLSQEGQIPDYPCIILSNHRSYIDPILMLCHVDAYPVAKAELANWPIIGKGAKMAGILYLRRENIKSRAGTLQRIHEIIDAGFSVIIFPEGTTSALSGTLPFKRGVFQLGAKTGIPIVPVALSFQHKADFWVGKESFLSHAGRRFKEKEIHVSVHYGPIIQGEASDVLLDRSRAWIEERLQRDQKEFP
jgi:lyso-ornithine lipid O-acyltransferase